MSDLTESEALFEEYCESNGIPCYRIKEDDSRTPDYEIFDDDKKIIVEVKQIEPNSDDETALQELKEDGFGSVSYVPGHRVRKKIKALSALSVVHLPTA
jgi:hypothetical protein